LNDFGDRLERSTGGIDLKGRTNPGLRNGLN
jgi:hypothetical protein